MRKNANKYMLAPDDAEDFDLPSHSSVEVDYTPNSEGQDFQINTITCNGETVYDLASGLVDRFDNRDLLYIESLIHQDAEISNHHDRLDDLSHGPRDNEQHEEFAPREYHRLIEKRALRQKRLDELEGEEELFEIPDSFHTPTARPFSPEMNTITEDPEDVFEQQFGDVGTGAAPKVDEVGNVIPEVEEDEAAGHAQAIDKDAFLPLDEVRQLAPLDAEEFGYGDIDVEEGPNDSVIYKTYIMPASSRDRIELKGLLSRLYSKTKESSGGSWNKDNTLNNELEEVDTLNDLEIKHALHYYKKIDRMSGKKIQHSPGERYLDAPNVNRI